MQQAQEIQNKKEKLNLSSFLDKLKFPLTAIEAIVLIFMIIVLLILLFVHEVYFQLLQI